MTIKRLHIDDLKMLRSATEFAERDKQVIHFALEYIDKGIRKAFLDEKTECGFQLDTLLNKACYAFYIHVLNQLVDADIKANGLNESFEWHRSRYQEDHNELICEKTYGLNWFSPNRKLIKPTYWEKFCLPVLVESLQSRGFRSVVVDPLRPPDGVTPLPKRKGKYLHVWIGLV